MCLRTEREREQVYHAQLITLAFKNFVGEQAIFQKAAFIFGNLVMFGLATYKVHSMGLLPTYQSDWLEFQEPQKVSRCKLIN